MLLRQALLAQWDGGCFQTGHPAGVIMAYALDVQEELVFYDGDTRRALEFFKATVREGRGGLPGLWPNGSLSRCIHAIGEGKCKE